MDLTVKGGKKPKQVTFDRGGQREEAKIKGNKITVGDGLSADSSKTRDKEEGKEGEERTGGDRKLILLAQHRI